MSNPSHRLSLHERLLVHLLWEPHGLLSLRLYHRDHRNHLCRVSQPL